MKSLLRSIATPATPMQPEPADTPTPIPQPGAPTRGCGSVALVPAAIALWMVRRRKD
jgi:hypothetical protein